MLQRITMLIVAAAGLAACATPVETLRATAYGEIVRAQVAAGDRSGARKSAVLALVAWDGDKKDSSNQYFTLSAVAVARARAGDLVGAGEIFDTIAGDIKHQALPKAILGLALAEMGKRKEALDYALAAKMAVAGLDSAHTRWEALAMAAWVEAEAGNIAGALRTAGAIGNPDYKAAALARVAIARADNGDETGALETAGTIPNGAKIAEVWGTMAFAEGIAIDPFKAVDFIVWLGDIPPRVMAMQLAAIALADGGDREAASRALSGAADRAKAIQETGDRISVLAKLALTRARIGQKKGALVALDKIEALDRSARARDSELSIKGIKTVEVVRAALSDGRDIAGQEKRIVALGIEPVEFRFLVGTARTRLGDLSGAAVSIDRTQALLGSDADRPFVILGLANLAVAQMEAGDAAAARESANKALAVANGIPEALDITRAEGMFMASLVLARTGDIKAALAAADQIRRAPPSVE